MPVRRRLLYVTDLAYPARGRRYCDEDIFLTSRLRAEFDIALCRPLDAAALLDGFDAVVVRNSGPVLHHQEAYDAFRERATALGTRVYNPLTGRADMVGKQYLLDLTGAGYPVIPTVDRPEDLTRLPKSASYAVKPKAGADSLGLRFLTGPELTGLTWGDVRLVELEDLNRSWGLSMSESAQPHAPNGLGRSPTASRAWEVPPGPRRTQPRGGDTHPVRGPSREAGSLTTWPGGYGQRATERPRTLSPEERRLRTPAPFPVSRIARSP
ncbi:hypothetical protein E4N62_06040 [Streptomyces sp. MNU76]|uniref:hypothetical protein n=1 Tax=Streptomyces sp. MNU76 TaxID=2560026 RepID=UPI001E3AFB83|nr:hypothetical protein [Streptomyces sp. MNU76]MCC9704856.1 hypothetical protein [Streptomyces sp. MNU76]